MTALLLLAVVALVALNGFFVAAEFALVRVRRSRVEALAEEGSRGARRVLGMLDEISEYLAACQFGITLASLAIGFLGEPAIADLVEPVLPGGLSHALAVTIAVGFAYVVTTAAHITVGEQVPKIFSIVRPESTALRIARPLQVFTVCFRPAIALLNRTSNGMLRLLGIEPDAAQEEGGTPEELKMVIAQSLAGGHLEENEAGMLSGVFHLHEQEARQVMTPIPAVVTIDVHQDVRTALESATTTGHTRLVVTADDNPDHVKGIVHLNELARRLMDHGPEASLEPVVREVPFFPETKPLDDLLAELQRQRTSLAVIVDEYGRTAGIVTIEDIIEEVVGEISDETDPAGASVRQLANGDWFVRGHVAVTDLLDYGLELPVDTDAYNSVGGFVFAQLGRLPRRGDSVRANGFSIRVESVRENRIEAVRIRDRGPVARRPG